MKLTQLRIVNFCGIKAFSITKTGKMNVITGTNGAGKSSILLALRHLLDGSGIKMDIVHNDADKTEVFAVFDNGLSIERATTRTSTKPKILHADGTPLTGPPQAFLNKLFAGHGFNPVEFFQAKPAERLKQLLASMPFILKPEVVLEAAGELAGHLDLESVDFAPHGIEVLSEIATRVYDNRHMQNQQVTRLTKSIELERQQLPDTTDLDRFDGFDYDDASSSLQAANNAIAEHRAKEAKLNGLREAAIQITKSIAVAKQQLADLEGRLVKVQTEGKQVAAEVEDFEEPEVAQLRQDLSDYQQAQEVLLAQKAIKRRESELQDEREKHEALDSLYKILHNDLPTQVLSEMKLPMEGLAIDGNRIMVKDVSLDGLCTQERMDFAVDFAKLTAGEFGIICIDNWEGLSPANQKLFVQSASKGKDDRFEYFMAKVTDGKLRHEILGSG